MRRKLACSAFLAALLATPAWADPAVTYAGLKYLAPGSGTFAFRADLAYDLVEEVSKGRSKATFVFNMMAAGLARTFGFDLSSRTWLETAGIDPQTPVVGSLPGLDLAAARAMNRRLEAAARKHLARKKAGESRFDADAAAGLAPLTGVRLVLTLKDASKVRAFLDAFPNGPVGSRYVKLEGATRDEVAPKLKTALECASDADAVALAEALVSRQSYALLRPSRDLWIVLRIREDRHLVVDLVGSWIRAPEKPDRSLAKPLAALLTLPKRPALDLAKKGLAPRVFTDDASAAVLLLAKPMLQGAELEEEQNILRSAGWVKDAATFAQDLKTARTCVASLRRAPAGDLALSLVGSKSALRGRGFWAAPATLTRLLQGAAAKQDLIDPSSWQSKAVAFAGTTLAVGPLLAGLRGPFKGLEEAEQAVRRCRRMAPPAMLLGGWAALLGALQAEGTKTPIGKLLLGHLQNGVVLLRELYSTRNPLFLGHLVVGPKLPVAKVKEELAKLYPDTQGKPQELTVGGRSATLYRFLKAPLQGLSGAVTDLGAGNGSSVTLSSRPWDLQWLLSQILGETPTPLPRTILVFAHANLGTILATVAREAGGTEGAFFKQIAARLDRLGANLSLREGLVAAELDLSLKAK